MICRVNKYQSSDSHGDVESFLIKRGNFLQDVLKSLRKHFASVSPKAEISSKETF